MIKKATFFILFMISAITLLVSFNNDNKAQVAEAEKSNAEKIKIAACPSCYHIAQKLDSKKYQIISTNSTAESLNLLQGEQADMVLSGRTLKPNEGDMESVVLMDGFSFLADTEKVVKIQDLNNFEVYTDLDAELIKSKLSIKNIIPVEDIYNFLDKGIVITSWENTDYNRSSIVHIMEEDGKRLALSRRPTLYCPQGCKENVIADIYQTINK